MAAGDPECRQVQEALGSDEAQDGEEQDGEEQDGGVLRDEAQDGEVLHDEAQEDLGNVPFRVLQKVGLKRVALQIVTV